MHDVFISYAHPDKAVADIVCETLESSGMSCWIAPRDILPGMSWSEAIIDGIENCHIMLLIFSAGANASPQVCREIERAVHKGVAVMPLRVEDVLPDKEFEYFLGAVHWLDAWHPSVEVHLPHLLENVSAMLSRVAEREVNSTHNHVPPHPTPTFAPPPTPAPIDTAHHEADAHPDAHLSQAGLESVSLKADETLFQQGETGDSMYILEEGRMDVIFCLPNGTERTLGSIEPPATIGEMSLLLGKARAATVTARTDARLWRISNEKFQEGLKKRERWAVKMMIGIAQTLAHRVEDMNQGFIAQMDSIHQLEDQLKASPAADELEDLCDRLFTHGSF